MAKKKRGGFGRFLGALTGTPYERLLKQVEKLANEHADDERKLGKALKKLVDVVGTAYEEEEIDGMNTTSSLKPLKKQTRKAVHSRNLLRRMHSMLMMRQMLLNSSSVSARTWMTS